MALTTGLGATAMGYFIQGWFKFGGVEFFKIQAATSLGPHGAWDNKTAIYIGSAACAEFIADIFLCPLEAVRIRSVSDPTWANGLADGFVKMAKTEGIGGFYAGLVPILFKQIPYTIAKFVVQGTVADGVYNSMGKMPAEVSESTKLSISLGSGVIAGVASAIISHPADTLLSKVNKKGAGGSGSMMSRLANIAKEIGFVKLCTTGLAPRCVMIGTLTAGQCKYNRSNTTSWMSLKADDDDLKTTSLLTTILFFAFSPQSESLTPSCRLLVQRNSTLSTPRATPRTKTRPFTYVRSHLFLSPLYVMVYSCLVERHCPANSKAIPN